MLNKFTYDNVVKGLITISLLFMAFGTKAADFNGQVGIASDNYFRGINLSDGFGYSASGKLDLGNGIWAGASAMSLEESSDFLTKLGVGYGFDAGFAKIGVAYIDYGFQGLDVDGWEEVGVKADFDLFAVSYFNGLDDAGDYFSISTSALKVIDLAYGDHDNSGSFVEVSKSFDLAGGVVKVGFVDHEDNSEDFADKITEVDNFYVGYSYKF
jgi:hypothetical protein